MILADYNPDDPLDVAEGYRMLTRLLRGSLESRLEYGDPLHPELISCVCHETIKIVAENPDNHYLGSSIDGRHDYRVWGTRGDARWISFNVFPRGGFGGGSAGVGATLHEDQLVVEPDGTFELWCVRQSHEGNCCRSPPTTGRWRSARRSSTSTGTPTPTSTSSGSATTARRPRRSIPPTSTASCSSPATT